MRHREITSKAVSAILMLTLKWFKASRTSFIILSSRARTKCVILLDIMKFHHLGQLLLDSNCILLVLKMFGMQEVSSVIVAKNEIPDCKYVPSPLPPQCPKLTLPYSFFKFCNLNFSRNGPSERPEDDMISPPPRTEDDVELITDFSWRNFFANINFVKIVQKLSKGRSHRIWLLVQYKSSVSFQWGSRCEGRGG